MIPKTIHYCWFGGKPKPDSFYKWLDTWKKHCPGYNIIEWNEQNFDINICAYSKEAYATRNFAFVSDVCRVYALLKYGGIYLDTDVEVTASFDRFLSLNAFLGIEHDLVGTGMMASVENAAWLVKFMEYYHKTHFINIWGHTVRTPNTKILTQRILPKLQLADCPTIFPRNFFCGINWETKEVNITPDTVTVHHFAASWRRTKTFSQKISSLIEGFVIRYFRK